MSSHTLSLLSDADNLTDFDCGDADLNEFLQNDAKENQKNWLSATRILYDNNKIIGYFTLIADTLNRERVNETDRVEDSGRHSSSANGTHHLSGFPSKH